MSTTLPAPELETRHPAPAAERDAPPPPQPAPRPPRERLLSLDVFRGMTVAGMLLVNDPGTWSHIYPPLEHAAWHGWTPTDLVFPFFLFIVGITTHLSLSTRRARGDDEGAIVRQVLRRGALIFLFGLILNAFPFYQWGPPASWGYAGEPRPDDPTFWDRVAWRFEHLRIMGVLQRIGIAYIISALLTLRTTVKQQVVTIAAILFGYWFAMTALPVPDTGHLGALVLDRPGATLDAWLDRVLLGSKHLWSGAGGLRDPEGLLSTLPAACTAMLGVIAGRWIGTARPIYERLAGLFAAGALGMMLGLMWNWVFPINKPLWTSSYVLFTAGLACVSLATCMWLIDVHRVTGWTKPFVIYGVNPMIAFLGSGLMARWIYSMHRVEYQGRETSLQNAIYQGAFASWLRPEELASFAFAVTFVLVWLGILWVLYRRNIVLKV